MDRAHCTTQVVRAHALHNKGCSCAHYTIGRVSLAREKEAGGSWGQEVHAYDFVLFLVVTISVILSEGLLQAEAVEHFAGDNDHGNRGFFFDYNGGRHGNSGKYLRLAILTNNEKCHFSRSTTCLGQTYTSVMIRRI